MTEEMKKSIKKSFIGTEELLKYGSLVEEALKEYYEEIYPEPVIRFASNACGMNREFWIVADSMAEIYEDERREFHRLSVIEGETQALKYYNWFLQKAADFERDRIRNGSPTCQIDGPWDEAEISRALRKLCAIDKRIAILRYGLDGEGLKPTETIAQLPEFDCDKSYIEKRLKSIERKARIRNIVFKKFEAAVKVFEHKERVRGGNKND